MEEKKIQKVNPGYLLIYLLVPALLIAACFFPAFLLDIKGGLAVVLVMGPILFAVLWWVFLSSALFKSKRKKMEQMLDSQGFVRNHTFDGGGCIVIIDRVHKNIALLFRWNPFHPYILPAARIQKAWVDDGRGGAGFLEGSSRVSFLLAVDGIKIRVNTFTSNKRWRMDSDYILTGISKADLMVEILNETKKQEA